MKKSMFALIALFISLGLYAAETSLTVHTANDEGVALTMTAADTSNGNQFVNDGSTVIFAYNSDASTATITLVTAATAGGLAIADPAVAVAPSGYVEIGPFSKGIFNNTSGTITMSYTNGGNTSLAVVSYGG